MLVGMMMRVVIAVRVNGSALALRAAPAGLRYHHLDVIGVECTAAYPLHVELEGHTETGEIGHQRALGQAEIEQLAEQHVARDSREGVEVEDSQPRAISRLRSLLRGD
jgi:hypothetical protein